MAENSYPFGVSAGAPGDLSTEDQWTKMARLFGVTGVAGDPGSAAVQVYADSSGRQVLVRTGRALVRGVFYENTSTKTVAIAANSTGSTRIDRVVLKLDPTSNTITAVAKTGSTSPPSLTQDDTGVWEMPLARVTVANGATGIAAGSVTDERIHAAAPLVPCRLVTDIANQAFATVAAEFATGLLKWWNGTSWLTIPNFNDLPRLLGYAEITSPFSITGPGSTPVDIPGLSTTVTVGAGQRIKIRADIQGACSGGEIFIYIREGGNILNSRKYPVTVAGASLAIEAILAPTAGVHTYTASLSTSGLAFDGQHSAPSPGFIHAEFLGVNS